MRMFVHFIFLVRFSQIEFRDQSLELFANKKIYKYALNNVYNIIMHPYIIKKHNQLSNKNKSNQLSNTNYNNKINMQTRVLP